MPHKLPMDLQGKGPLFSSSSHGFLPKKYSGVWSIARQFNRLGHRGTLTAGLTLDMNMCITRDVSEMAPCVTQLLARVILLYTAGCSHRDRRRPAEFVGS